VERAVPVHGRWPAYLSGPLQDRKKVDQQLVESELGALECEGATGWIHNLSEDASVVCCQEVRCDSFGLNRRSPTETAQSIVRHRLETSRHNFRETCQSYRTI
jgi:hypothetical protein